MNRFSPVAVIFVVSCAVLLGHMLPFGEQSLLFQNLRNALHGPAFLLLSVVVWRTAYPHSGTRGATLFAGITAFVVAIGGETLQFAGGHPFSLRDIAFDLLGCVTALLYLSGRAARRDNASTTPAARFGETGAGVLLIVLLLPLAWWSSAIGIRAASMPQLTNVEFPWWRELIDARAASVTAISPPAGWPSDIGQVLRIETSAARFAGVAIVDPYPDWTEYTSLVFLAATGDGDERRLSLRIHDEAHDQEYTDRFNRSWHLYRPEGDGHNPVTAAPQRFCIPLSEIERAPAGREMDLEEIAGVGFFVTWPEAGDVFLLGDVRLEKSSGEPCRASPS